jgi:hypothetical protein
MKFIEGRVFIDRVGTRYTFLKKSGGVTTFVDESVKLVCRNENGWYRWDDIQTPVDIISEYVE